MGGRIQCCYVFYIRTTPIGLRTVVCVCVSSSSDHHHQLKIWMKCIQTFHVQRRQPPGKRPKTNIQVILNGIFTCLHVVVVFVLTRFSFCCAWMLPLDTWMKLTTWLIDCMAHREWWTTQLLLWLLCIFRRNKYDEAIEVFHIEFNVAALLFGRMCHNGSARTSTNFPIKFRLPACLPADLPSQSNRSQVRFN